MLSLYSKHEIWQILHAKGSVHSKHVKQTERLNYRVHNLSLHLHKFLSVATRETIIFCALFDVTLLTLEL